MTVVIVVLLILTVVLDVCVRVAQRRLTRKVDVLLRHSSLNVRQAGKGIREVILHD